MSSTLRGWTLVEEVFGPRMARRLRNGLPVDIAAANGQIYRIQQNLGLVNLTRMERYCAHPGGPNYNFPDMAVIWYDYITLKPEHLEAVAGGPMSGHRFALLPGELDRPRRRSIHGVRNIHDVDGTYDGFQVDGLARARSRALNDFVRLCSVRDGRLPRELPMNIQTTVKKGLNVVATLYRMGDIVFEGRCDTLCQKWK